MTNPKRTWLGIVGVAIAAVATLVLVDFGAAHLAPPVNRREVEDGVRDLSASNPDILVLGSSHARTFHAVGQLLAQRTSNGRTLVDVPVEHGKLVVYDWVLRNRLVPLIEEKNADGTLKRDRLRQFVLLTEWWDSCAPTRDGKLPYWNLPARAWTFKDFGESVIERGLDGFNRNYLQNRLRRAFSRSALVYDRTQGGLMWRVVDWIKGESSERTPEDRYEQDLAWQRTVEKGNHCIGNSEQMAALADIVDYARNRGLDVTIVLFPRKPITITDVGRQTTIRNFETLVRARMQPRDVRVLDMTLKSPLTDADFMEDNDHVNMAGNVKFAAWALDNELKFLLPQNAMARSQGPLMGEAR